jgi:hypothetical protein
MTPDGIFKPKRLPQGAVDSPLYFHSQMALQFDELIRADCMLL